MADAEPVVAHWCGALDERPDTLDLYGRVRSGLFPWLLDSAFDASPMSRFSFLGCDPYAVLRIRGRRCMLDVRRSPWEGLTPGRRVWNGDALEALRAWTPRLDVGAEPAPLPFVGGAGGWLGYDLAAELEPIDLGGRDDHGLPDAMWLLCDRLLAIDHATATVHASGLGFGSDRAQALQRARDAAQQLAARLGPPAAGSGDDARARSVRSRARLAHDARSYGRQVEAVKQRIAAGDVYQACLTHRIDLAREPGADWDPWTLYRRIRQATPAPFGACLELPEAAILTSSPERFLRLDREGAVEARPIKGTRPRGASPVGDAALRDALEASEKDRAENLMIVDLYRNDLGRVCEPGSTEVPELFRVEPHPTVHQLVSTVRGRLARGRDALDLVRAAFPPGSMTGAPKLAAMAILAGLEPISRGPYAGALGYLDAGGAMELAVVIRTAIVQGERAWVHTGGGIVADSEPEAEYRETLDKAVALLAAFGAEFEETERAAEPLAAAGAQP